MDDKQGFTLVELAIVLVIIGLIVGGVLVGQDMIKAAEVRGTVGQVEKYNAAVNTFRTKYAGLPGDLLSTKAANYGMVARTGTDGHGDGDGLLEVCGSSSPNAGCEVLLFWRDLSFANMVDGNFTTATDDFANGGNPIATNEVPLFFPAAKLGRGNYFTVLSDTGANYYELIGIVSTDDAGAYTLSANLTPNEALNIDIKMDDGAPGRGSVQAVDATDLNTLASDGGACRVNINTYETSTAIKAVTPACGLRFHFN